MTLATFADAEEVLATRLPGYQARPQQQRLAVGVEATLASPFPVSILAQAGCGVGKSLGALIPSILATKEDPETGHMVPMRVIVATATKALQEQYANTDLPFLEANLGHDFTWALLKGRSNYVCQARLAELTASDLPMVEELRAELAEEAHSGDFEHLTTQVPQDKQYLLSMSSAECPGRQDCPFAEICFAERAKEIAKNSQVVITNTAMLMTELRIQKLSEGKVRMLGEYDAVVIDEAHELPEIAQGALADQFRLKGIENLATQVEGFFAFHGQDIPNAAEELRTAARQVWDHLALYATDDQVELKIETILGNSKPYRSMVIAAKALAPLIEAVQIGQRGTTRTEKAKQVRLIRRCVSLVEKFTEFLTSEGLVRWVETDEIRRGSRRPERVTVLKYSPIEVGPFLRRHLWSKVPAVLLSATLSVGDSFDYISREMGLTRPETLDVGTPFDYATQGRLFIPPKDAPTPKDRGAWQSYAQRTTLDLVQTSGGGALLLYTSRRAMQDAYEMLSPIMEMAGLTCFMQGHPEHGTNKEIASKFKKDTHSVLFALKSFFTGVDFSGDTCRLVVIDKLPFPVPTEIMFNAKANLLNARMCRDVSFYQLSVPMMTLVLIQGVGRLIRSVNDRGVVAILDGRLASTGWGKNIVRDLPAMPVISQMNSVKGFYEGL